MAGKFGAFWINAGSKNDGLDEKDSASLTPFNTKCSETTVVMQFTGREDLNGKEVWEGDIIENCDTKLLQVVYWHKNNAAWYCRYIDDKKRVVSLWESLGNLNNVIGNIYQNPNLLNIQV